MIFTHFVFGLLFLENEVAIYEELYASRHGNRADNIVI